MLRSATVFLSLAILSATAIAERPAKGQKSPWQFLQQMIGDSLVEVEYSRPGVKGRTIWGELVPYGEIWRAGANERTVVSFEDDVLINGERLAADDYGLFVIPEEDSWTFIFTRAFMGHGADGYDVALDVLRVTAKPEAAEHQEWMTFGVTGFEENAAVFYLHWAELRCGFRVEIAE